MYVNLTAAEAIFKFLYVAQAHKGLCAATGRTPRDQAREVLLPGAEATLVQTGLVGKGLHPGYDFECPQNSGHCG